MTKILFKKARLIDPALNMDTEGDLLVENGIISAVGPALPAVPDAEVVECNGAVLAPGLVDVHVHVRDPGQTAKEALETGCLAAANGGFTAVITMANTSPAVDTAEAITDCIERNKTMDCRVYPAGAVTYGLKGQERTDFEALKAAGALCLTDDGMTVGNSVLQYEIMEKSVDVDLPVSVHCEAPGFEGDRSMNRGEISKKLGLVGAPAVAEEFMIMRDVFFAEKTGAHVHVQHVSSKRGVEIIEAAKKRGVRVTAEATPHHMFLDETAILECGSNAKMSPPLRLPEDKEYVRQALINGTLDVIATDHAPHTVTEKLTGMAKAPNGIIGLETSLALCVHHLHHEDGVPMSTIIERMSTAPRRIFKLPAVNLQPGSPADLVLIDTEKEWLVDATQFKSKARNCPFSGQTLKGQAVMTVLGGRITCDRR